MLMVTLKGEATDTTSLERWNSQEIATKLISNVVVPKSDMQADVRRSLFPPASEGYLSTSVHAVFQCSVE